MNYNRNHQQEPHSKNHSQTKKHKEGLETCLKDNVTKIARYFLTNLLLTRAQQQGNILSLPSEQASAALY